ncbi:ubiquitin/ribosomal S27A fusion protein 3 [Biomphalaria pfeifferi]|uniref:Ubiquitin/ribosomal S27A fusion protein 3 n=1 Tax=Biomphalaria pfeifferi TaxID=112525 RepID=A0AAD8FCN4_BIOPF|nr:ubiquitin/ribosomal S27A fusion protein 3 [Biomphalaria pfeifferi]
MKGQSARVNLKKTLKSNKNTRKKALSGFAITSRVVAKCKYSLRPSRARPSHLRSSPVILLKMSKLKFKIKKAFLQISRVLRLRGGGKKRKKKNYTTPKKNKHKKKKVKLAVLKYYKVDENGKITRLRRECPNKYCGAGVFMASHFDRQYCGKCCLTYVFNKPEEEAES